MRSGKSAVWNARSFLVLKFSFGQIEQSTIWQNWKRCIWNLHAVRGILAVHCWRTLHHVNPFHVRWHFFCVVNSTFFNLEEYMIVISQHLVLFTELFLMQKGIIGVRCDFASFALSPYYPTSFVGIAFYLLRRSGKSYIIFESLLLWTDSTSVCKRTFFFLLPLSRSLLLILFLFFFYLFADINFPVQRMLFFCMQTFRSIFHFHSSFGGDWILSRCWHRTKYPWNERTEY